MKRLLMTLFGIILATTTIFSQVTSKDTVVTITPTQLKTTNLIFAEHQKLSEQVPLLQAKITNLSAINGNLVKVDSLRLTQVNMYKQALEGQNADIKQLKKSLKTTKYIAGGSVLTTILLAIICIFK